MAGELGFLPPSPTPPFPPITIQTHILLTLLTGVLSPSAFILRALG